MSFFTRYKKPLTLVSIIIIAIIVLIFFLQFILGIIIENKIENAIQGKESKQYNIDVGSAKINLFTMTFILKDIIVTPDSLYLSKLSHNETSFTSMVEANIPKLRVRNIGALGILMNNYINIGGIVLDDARICIYNSGKKNPSDGKKSLASPNIFKLDSIVLPGIGGGVIDRIDINEFGLIVYNVVSSDTVFATKSINLSLDNISLIKNDFDSTSFRLKLKDIDFNLKNEKFLLPGGKYTIEFEDLKFIMNTQKAEFKNLAIKPRFRRSKMVGLSKYQYEIFDVEISKVDIDSINIRQIINNSGIYISNVVVDGMDLKIFKDKRNPFDESKRPLLPQQLLKNLKKDLYIDSLTIKNSVLVYSERHTIMKELMTVTLGSFNVKVKNITSVTDSIINGVVMSISLRANLQNAIPMGVDMIFPMKSVSDTFMFSGYLGSGNMKKFNSVVLPAVGIKFESGTLDKLTFKATANPTYSIGSMKMQYHDLMGDVQKQGVVESNKFLSWLANSVIISNNPVKGKDVRNVPMYFNRVVYKGLGNFVWKTLQSGIMATIVPTVANKVQSKIDVELGTSSKTIKKRDKEEKRKQRKKTKLLP